MPGDILRHERINQGLTLEKAAAQSRIRLFVLRAIESGETPGTIFYCENGAYRIGKNVVHDHKRHGWLSLQQIIKYSSNIGAVKVSEKIGAKKLYQTFRYFGFGEKTGIDCPGGRC